MTMNFKQCLKLFLLQTYEIYTQVQGKLGKYNCYTLLKKMKFKIIEKGKSYLIPIEGFVISGIDMRNFLGLELREEGTNLPKFVIDINLNFELTRYNQTNHLQPHDIESTKVMLDLIGLKIKKAECSKTGDLYIVLDDGTEINVPDAQYESWHINIIHQERIKNTWVIGGVGITSFFELNE